MSRFTPCTSLLLAASLALAGGSGCSGGENNPPPAADLAAAPADMESAGDLASRPDMAFKGNGAVGAPCTDASDCRGSTPRCLKRVNTQQAPISAPRGYCTVEPCKTDNDCGAGGYCFPLAGYCLGRCSGKGECAKTNPANRCFWFGEDASVCLPLRSDDACDPTSLQSCGGTGACQRGLGNIDDIGECLPTCKLGEACPPLPGGAPQACKFLNFRVTFMGTPTQDVFAGLVCIRDGSGGAGPANSPCMYWDECRPGYQCNVWMAGGVGKICRKLCVKGMTVCDRGTCQNAFKLGAFNAGDIGLCL